jgi:hypothetical protein
METTALDALVRQESEGMTAVVGGDAPQHAPHQLAVDARPSAMGTLGVDVQESTPVASPVEVLPPAEVKSVSSSAYRCPRCDAPVSQPVYAAAMRWGAKWKGCEQCSATHRIADPAQ